MTATATQLPRVIGVPANKAGCICMINNTAPPPPSNNNINPTIINISASPCYIAVKTFYNREMHYCKTVNTITSKNTLFLSLTIIGIL